MLWSSKGFTLIELLIVVVIIGILAAIAIPKFANTKEKAYVSAMKSDLRNLAAAEEAYFADYLTYTTSTTNIDFNQSTQVTITIGTGTASGWAATAGHSGVSSTNTDVCELYYGGASGSTATQEGVVACG
jgi:prepilin-type N-terminal cleavage/methylation domain-containing protein